MKNTDLHIKILKVLVLENKYNKLKKIQHQHECLHLIIL